MIGLIWRHTDKHAHAPHDVGCSAVIDCSCAFSCWRELRFSIATFTTTTVVLLYSKLVVPSYGTVVFQVLSCLVVVVTPAMLPAIMAYVGDDTWHMSLTGPIYGSVDAVCVCDCR